MFLHIKSTIFPLSKLKSSARNPTLKRHFSATFNAEIDWIAPFSADLQNIYNSFKPLSGKPDLKNSVIASLVQNNKNTVANTPIFDNVSVSLNRIINKLKNITKTRFLNIYELSLIFELFFIKKFEFSKSFTNAFPHNLFEQLCIKESLNNIEKSKPWTVDDNRTKQFISACYFGLVSFPDKDENLKDGLNSALARAFQTVPMTPSNLNHLHKTNHWYYLESYKYEKANAEVFSSFPKLLKEHIMSVKKEPEKDEFDTIFTLFHFSLLCKSIFEFDWFVTSLNYFLWRKSLFSDDQAKQFVNWTMNLCNWNHMPHVGIPRRELLKSLLNQLLKAKKEAFDVFQLNYYSARLLNEFLDLDAFFHEIEQQTVEKMTQVHFLEQLLIFLRNQHPTQFAEFNTKTSGKLTKIMSEIERQKTSYKRSHKKILREQNSENSNSDSNSLFMAKQTTSVSSHIVLLENCIKKFGFKVQTEYLFFGFFWDFYLENFLERIRKSDLLPKNTLETLEKLAADPDFKVFLEVDDRVHNDPFVRLENSRFQFRSNLVSDAPVLVLKINTANARTIISQSHTEYALLRVLVDRTVTALKQKGLC